MSYGYIYVLSNECFPYLKIGHTKNDPEVRRQQLSRSQAIPTPFKLLFNVRVKNARRIEREVHHHFKDNCVGKEFFDIPIDIVREYFKNRLEVVSYNKYWAEKLRDALEERRIFSPMSVKRQL